MQQLTAAFGYVVLIGLAWLMSSHRGRFPWRIVAWGTALQITFAAVILKTAGGKQFFDLLGSIFTRLISFADKGSSFLFRDLSAQAFAFSVLPIIIFFSALTSVLYHIGVMQLVVKVIAKVMQQTLGTSGAESLSAAANIFVGQTEAPLVVRPFVARMTRSELMAIMVGGFATIAGSVMGIYVKEFGISAGHLLTASVISAPAGLLIAKVLQPETEIPETLGTQSIRMPKTSSNLIEAISNGAFRRTDAHTERGRNAPGLYRPDRPCRLLPRKHHALGTAETRGRHPGRCQPLLYPRLGVRTNCVAHGDQPGRMSHSRRIAGDQNGRHRVHGV
jgi:CNT family concentrative nucleoside transporter